jgi:hypothetical protein
MLALRLRRDFPVSGTETRAPSQSISHSLDQEEIAAAWDRTASRKQRSAFVTEITLLLQRIPNQLLSWDGR